MKRNILSLSFLLSFVLFSSPTFAQTDLTGATITLSQSQYVYDGNPCCPSVDAIRKGTKRYNSLREGDDYELKYEDNVNAGIATAILVFKGDYTGVATKEFTINGRNLTEDESVVLQLNETEVNYDGTAKKPGAQDAYWNGEPVDYLLSYTNNVNPGEATAKATFYGNFYGEKKASFTIKDSGNVPPSSLTVKYYDSSEATPQVEREMTYAEFQTLQESFPNAYALAPKGFDVWPLDKANVVVEDEEQNYSCGIFTLTDEKDFFTVAPISVKTLSYSRALDEGYNTCFLPFSVGIANFPEGTKMYGLDAEAEYSDVLIFTPIESAEANTPFLVVSPGACTWNISVSDVLLESTAANSSEANRAFVGTYLLTDEYKYAAGNPYFGLSESQFVPLEEGLSPFRACVKVSNGESSQYEIILADADVLTLLREQWDMAINILKAWGSGMGTEEVTPIAIAVNEGYRMMKRIDSGEVVPNDEMMGLYLRLKAITDKYGNIVTGIANVNGNVNDNRYYDLQGRRAVQPTKGIYILHGKRVVK